MNATDQANLRCALSALPHAARIVKFELEAIARAVPIEFRRQRVNIGATGNWGDVIPCTIRGFVAHWHLFMLRLSLCIHSEARIDRHVEALRRYLAIPKKPV